MSTLIVVTYDDPFKAEEVRLNLRKLQRENLLDVEDAVVAVKDEKGKVKLHQAVNLTATGAVSGGFWGTLIGLIFLNPTARLVGCCRSSRHILLAANSLAGAHDFPIPSEAAHEICGLCRKPYVECRC